MHIEGFEQIKKYYKMIKEKEKGKGYLTFHKMKNGIPFAIICTPNSAEAICYNKQRIERLCLSMFMIKSNAEGLSYLHIGSIKSRDRGLGVGSEVINVLKHHGIKNNCKYIYLVSVNSAEKFYEKIGFNCMSARAEKLKDYTFNLEKLTKKSISNS